MERKRDLKGKFLTSANKNSQSKGGGLIWNVLNLKLPVDLVKAKPKVQVSRLR